MDVDAHTVWRKDGKKTMYDPCPPGYCVPVYDDMLAIKASGVDTGFHKAGAIWYTLWNDRRSKTYASWAARNGYRDSGTHEAWLNLQEINEARGDNYIFEGAPVTQEEYDQDYLSRGYYPTRTGEVRVLEEWDPMRDRNEALDNAFMYFGEGNSAAPELFEEAFIDWYENPDYEGQTFDNYLSNYGDMTPAARRIFSGTGQKAVRREALDYAHAAYVFLDGFIQPVVFLEYAAEGRHSLAADEEQAGCQKGDKYDKGRSQCAAHDVCHDDGEDQHQRGPHRRADDHHIGHLHGAHVRGHTGHERGGGEFVDVLKGITLYLVEHSLTQILGKACGCLGAGEACDTAAA